MVALLTKASNIEITWTFLVKATLRSRVRIAMSQSIVLLLYFLCRTIVFTFFTGQILSMISGVYLGYSFCLLCFLLTSPPSSVSDLLIWIKLLFLSISRKLVKKTPTLTITLFVSLWLRTSWSPKLTDSRLKQKSSKFQVDSLNCYSSVNTLQWWKYLSDAQLLPTNNVFGTFNILYNGGLFMDSMKPKNENLLPLKPKRS